MWWRRRALAGGLLAGAAAGLAGCGFAPLYEESGAAQTGLARIAVERIDDRAGQQLRNALLVRLPPRGAQPAAWRLRVTLSESRRTLGVEPDDVATRANLAIAARYTLEDAVDGRAALSGEVRSTNSYNILESTFGTLAAERDARVRAVRQLADALTVRLAAWFAGLGADGGRDR